MLLFCPNCNNSLTISVEPVSRSNRFECHTCPYQMLMKNQPLYDRQSFFKRDRDLDIISSDDTKNAEKVQEACPRPDCEGQELAFIMMQTRSADEPMTKTMKCITCGHTWRE